MEEKAGIHGHGVWELFGPDKLLKAQGKFTNLITQVGDQYYGDRAAGIAGAALTTNAITNADPAVVTVTTAHGLSVGDSVTLASVTAATTDLNNSWVVESTPSSTTFGITLGVAPGAVSDAAGTATPARSLGKVTGLKLGTGTTAVAKTGAGAALVTYKTGTHVAPTSVASSLSGSSRRITYVGTWGAGVGTDSALAEVVITNESPISDATSTAAQTISRALLSPTINKGAGDTLVVTWNHDLLGA